MAADRLLLNFELSITSSSVEVLDSPAGQAQSVFVPPLSTEHSQQLLAALGGGSATLAELEAAGTQLFAAVFQGPIHTLYERSRAIVGHEQGLRFKLRLDPALTNYPWELLRDPADDFLALIPGIAIVRYQPMQTPSKPVAVSGPLRMLLVSGHAPDLNLAREIQAVQQALASLGTQLSLDLLEAATLDSLFAALSSKPYHMLHYLGHGQAASAEHEGGLILQNADGDAAVVTTQAIWRLLRRFETLRLVWLNACSSAVGTAEQPLRSVAVELVRAGIPAVIAHQQPIRDRVAVKLARAFYSALAARFPIDAALAEARASLGLQDLASLEWAIPILFLRAPDGILFESPEPANPAAISFGTSAAGSAPSLINLGQGNHMQAASFTFGDVGGTIIKGAQRVNVQPSLPTTPPNVSALQTRLAQLRQAQAALIAAQTAVPDTLLAELQTIEQQLTQLDQATT